MRIIPIFLAGGVGSRIWPLSTPDLPKQFLNLFNQGSMLQQSVLRLKQLNYTRKPIIITNQSYLAIVERQMQEIAINDYVVIAEPISKNTAPAIALAANYVNENYPDDIMLVKPTDHDINDSRLFCDLVSNQFSNAINNIILFGRKPTRPSTEYGYIQISTSTDNNEYFVVDEFVEKPDKDKATLLINKPNIYWNCGIFLMSARIFLEELYYYKQDLFKQCAMAYNNRTEDGNLILADKPSFECCDHISVDKAVIEKSKKLFMLSLDCDWRDLGGWQELENKGITKSMNYSCNVSSKKIV